MPSSTAPEGAARSAAIRKRIAAKGMTIDDLGRKVGFTRNITYGVLKGRKLKLDEAARVDDLLGPETQRDISSSHKNASVNTGVFH